MPRPVSFFIRIPRDRQLSYVLPLVARPLKVVTGKGSHSANGVGVLRPAVKSALVQDGWNVGTWDAGLVVRGKENWAS